MGREVRRVPKDWEHPRDENGYHIPLHDGKYLAENTKRWDLHANKWAQGMYWNYLRERWERRGKDEQLTYELWAGPRPDPGKYMPAWPEEERTHWQMYENTTEGTPISPAMETPEDLAQWLVANKASAFGTSSAPYGRWMEIIMKESE